MIDSLKKLIYLGACLAELLQFPLATPSSLLQNINTDIPDPTLFRHVDTQKLFYPPHNVPAMSASNAAIPTNRWWGNIIHAPVNGNPLPAWSNPFSIKIAQSTSPFGIEVGYPFNYRFFGPLNENGANKFYGHAVNRDMMMSGDFIGSPTFQVVNWDDVGINVQFRSGTSSLKSYLAAGMAFITSEYQSLAPIIISNHALLTVNGIAVQPGTSVTGNKFILNYNNGFTWVVYAPQSPITFITQANGLRSNNLYSGGIRIALIDSSNNQNQYDRYSACILQGGQLLVPNAYEYSFKWSVSGNCNNGVLHFSLQHQVDVLDSSLVTQVPITLQSTTRGAMRAYATTTDAYSWRLRENEDITLDFYPDRYPSKSNINKYSIVSILQQDINNEWPIQSDGSYYFTGKAAQKYATLCLLANDQNLVGSDRTLFTQCISKLRNWFSLYLSNSWKYPLVYDTIYGGIIASIGFSLNDMNQDFGNGVYNDHHFHFGYWITAASIVRYLDPTWNGIGTLTKVTNTLLRDVANPNISDPWFPTFRHFDWFLGHSYSHGVIPLGDGKDEESTSEEINGHYGMMLWGRMISNSAIENLGKLLLKVNSRAIKTYFLISDGNTVHPEGFRKNKVSGIFFDNKVDYASWFSPERYCIHGIQMIPVSPATVLFRTETFVSEEWNQILSKLPIVLDPTISDPWQSLLFANLARIDFQQALDRLARVPLDDGLSRSWALYYAASMDKAAPLRLGNTTIVTPGPTIRTPSTSTIPSSTFTPSTSTIPAPIPAPIPTTPAPTRISTPSCEVAVGDLSLGINMYYDETCGINGGLGCDMSRPGCRFCVMANASPQLPYVACPSTTNPSRTPSRTPEANPVTPSIPSTTECVASIGDLQGGINMFYDITCVPSGGVGCDMSRVGCRFCRIDPKDTRSSYISCPTATTLPSSTSQPDIIYSPEVLPFHCILSQGDFEAGIRVYVDESCVSSGGLGCDMSQPSCRFCNAGSNSPAAIAFLPCPLENPAATPVPTFQSPSATIPTAIVCTASEGDIQAGIRKYYDETCKSPLRGIGCDSSEPGCRFCHVGENLVNTSFLPCPIAALNSIQSASLIQH